MPQIGLELDTLERIQNELAAVATRTDDRRRHDLVDLRRKLSMQIAVVGEAADSLFAAIVDPSINRTYRDKFSRMRSAAALHQADWPAVRLGEDPEKYQTSALTVREANRDFVSWTRTTLLSDRR